MDRNRQDSNQGAFAHLHLLKLQCRSKADDTAIAAWQHICEVEAVRYPRLVPTPAATLYSIKQTAKLACLSWVCVVSLGRTW